MIIRSARKEDVDRIIEIEGICFPPAEAAGADDIRRRFDVFGENFVVAQVDGIVVGFVNGCTTDEPCLPDELYHDIKLHKPDGAYQTVFGLDVLPTFRRRGLATALINHLIELTLKRGKKGVVLTCKDHLVPFYCAQGFVHHGVSQSTHGGAVWNDMLLEFK